MKFIENRKGMTLVEIMVALVILLLSILFAVGLGRTASILNRRTRRQAAARYLASQFAERFKSISYWDTSIRDDGDPYDLDSLNTPDHIKNVMMDNQSFKVVWNVADNMLYDSTFNGVKTIKIFVIWGKDEKGRPLTYSLTMVKGRTS